MKNSTIIFIFFGLIFAGALIFAFIYLPKMAEASGLGDKNVVMEIPVDITNMRYIKKGISSFCVEKNNGLDFEVKANSTVLSPVAGIVTNIYSESNRIAIQPERNVLVSVSPVVKLNISVGDYVVPGDILGYSEDTNIHFILDNQKNDRYECPYLYLNETGKTIITNGLEKSPNSTGRICECDSLKY